MNSAVLTASLTGRIQFFLLRCVAANYSTTATAIAATSSCCVDPPFAELLPRGFAGHSPGSASRRESRVRAPGRTVRPSLRHLGDVHQPAVEVRKAACRWRCPTFTRRFRTRETSLPLQDLLPPSAREPEASRPVSARDTLQSACQSLPRSAPDSMLSRIVLAAIALAIECQRAFRACEGSGEARCHPGRGDDSLRPIQLNRRRRRVFARVTPGVTLHEAVTRA